MGVGALGVINRGVVSLIAPNEGDHLECDECGMCIDICPVGALTSGPYRYKTRPWEMEHVGTICTHCSNGCKTTLGVRNDHIIRGNNRDRSGINGEFLCVKGRYAFDFTDHPERLQTPLINKGGKLEPVSWAEAISHIAKKFQEVKDRGGKFGVIGSTRTTNEENYYLQKFARLGLGTNNIDHHRTGDVVTLLDALAGRTDVLANSNDFYTRKAILVLGAEMSLQQPFLAFQTRANFRHHGAHIYVITPNEVREDQIATAALRAAPGNEIAILEQLREKLAAEPELVIAFNDSVKGDAVRDLVAFGDSLGIPVRYCPLVDYSNSRGAIDMGMLPDLLPGYQPATPAGLTAEQMIEAVDLDVLWVVGSNPLEHARREWRKSFVVVQEMFMTETAKLANVVLPAASVYEKNGTVTNVCGEVQKLKKALNTMGTKPDLEIMGLIGREMGLAKTLGPWFPDQVFEEIRASVHGYNVPLPVIVTGGAAQTAAVNGPIHIQSRPDLIHSAHDNLFTSGNLGKYSKILNSVLERRTNTGSEAEMMEHYNP
jgi:NADH-quinone oxidoreductase subunit G